MDERAALKVSLPRSNPTISYWQDPPDELLADWYGHDLANLDAGPGSLPESTDIVIIGSGITGAGIAWELLSRETIPGAVTEKIVMLEARQASSGASGRNGGHTKAASYRSFADNIAGYGTAEAVKIASFEWSTMKATHEHARQRRINCDSWEGDTVDIIYDEAQWKQGLAVIDAMRKAMPDKANTAARYESFEYEVAREKFQVKGEHFHGAITYDAGSLSAYKFVIGVLKDCVKEDGFKLFTHTPVTTFKKDSGSGSWIVTTSKGQIRAKKVIIATNGYTGAIYPKFHSKIVPLRGHITAHRPGSNPVENPLSNTYSFIYEGGYEYMIPRPSGSKFGGDIIIGGGLTKSAEEGLYEFGTTEDTTVNPDISTYLKGTTARYFGPEGWGKDHPEGRIRKEWTGIMGYSADGFPYVGKVPGEEGLWIAASFQGHGMVLCWGVARAMGIMLKGTEEEKENLKKWFPSPFLVSEERLKKKFEGRLHTRADPANVEIAAGGRPREKT